MAANSRELFGLLPGLLRGRNAGSEHHRALGFRPLALTHRTALYPSKEVRDAMFASGMELGVAACYDGLRSCWRRHRLVETHERDLGRIPAFLLREHKHGS